MPQTESAKNTTNKPKTGGRRPRRGRGSRGRGRGRGGGREAQGRGGDGSSGGGSSKVNGGARTRNSKAGNTETNSTNSATGDQAALDNRTCMVCASEAKDWAVGECMHPVCSDCSHRMRVLYKRESCVLCNTLLNEVVVVPASDFKPDMPYSSIRKLAKTWDEEVRMHFVKPERAKELSKVRALKCSLCNYIAPTAEKLKQHARSRHNSVYCLVCFDGGASFVSELPLYPLARGGYSPKLREHMKNNHPQCKFCHTWFLTDDDLYAHLQTEHETCFICERQGRIHEYYRDFQELENHYRREHFACSDPGCRGVVFGTRVELQAHDLQHHMSNVPRSARRVRLNLADFAPQTPSAEEVREEQARQAARRRAFAAIHANFMNSENNSSNRIANGRGRNAASSDEQSNNERGSSETLASSSQNHSRAPQLTRRIPPPPVPTTSNTGTSSSVQPPGTASAREGVYRPLPLPQTQSEAQERSQILMRTMRSKLDPSAFELFKDASAQFRDGEIDATAFYRATIDAFGVRQAIRDIFPELIALLPDAEKRALLTNALSGRETEDGVAPQSTIDFPTLEGQRPVAPSIMPTVRTPYLPVPSAGDFPTLGRSSGGGQNSNQRQPAAQVMPQVNLHRVFGGATTPINLPEARRTRRNLTDAFGPFPALGSTTRPPPPAPMRSLNSVRQAAREPEPLYTSVATRPAPAPSVPARRTRAPPPAPNLTNNNTNDTPAFPALGRRTLETPATAFPSLGVISAAMLAPERTGHTNSTASSTVTTSTTTIETLSIDPDVTNRAGAPWGGNTHNTRRKRGPGGRTPAPPPAAVFGNSVSNARTNGGSGLSLAQAVREEETENRRRIERSALPKVGAGGFGFAWERKNNQKKKKAIKTEVLNKGGTSGGPGPSAGGASA